MILITTVLAGVASPLIGGYLLWRIKAWKRYQDDGHYVESHCMGGTKLPPVPLLRKMRIFFYAY